jgi:hypothetical protein
MPIISNDGGPDISDAMPPRPGADAAGAAVDAAPAAVAAGFNMAVNCDTE